MKTIYKITIAAQLVLAIISAYNMNITNSLLHIAIGLLVLVIYNRENQTSGKITININGEELMKVINKHYKDN